MRAFNLPDWAASMEAYQKLEKIGATLRGLSGTADRRGGKVGLGWSGGTGGVGFSDLGFSGSGFSHLGFSGSGLRDNTQYSTRHSRHTVDINSNNK